MRPSVLLFLLHLHGVAVNCQVVIDNELLDNKDRQVGDEPVLHSVGPKRNHSRTVAWQTPKEGKSTPTETREREREREREKEAGSLPMEPIEEAAKVAGVGVARETCVRPLILVATKYGT